MRPTPALDRRHSLFAALLVNVVPLVGVVALDWSLLALLVNVVPLVGVVALDWSLLALLVVYWWDLGVNLAFAAFEGLFAQLPPENDADPMVLGALEAKRGGLSIPLTPLSVRVANLPAVLVAVFVFGLVWVLVGVFSIGALGEWAAGTGLTESERVSAGFGVVAVFLGRAIDAGSEYFLPREYEDVPVQSPLQSALLPLLGIGGVMVVGSGLVVAGAPAPVGLASILSMKLAVDLGRIYHDRLVAFDDRTDLDIGLAVEFSGWPAVDADRHDATETVRPHRLALLIDGVLRGFRSTLCLVFVALSLALGLLGLATQNWAVVGLVAQVVAALLGIFAVFGLLDRTIRYLGMEYRVAGDVVGYDRLFGPQYRLTREQVADCEHRRTVADRVFGTRTLVVERDDDQVRLPHLPTTIELPDGD
ncbi:DUF6498-containing protein [Haloarchaeobius amylolyticus]|uniref:DUF6498-containing protein n=1 Tax=Haloarchaeobius amylolyticus TaxID=1198296 RepID=UPI00227176EC|nr:DUF6498-containing protein [Haloarchaeobius amylolyticus]